MSRKAGHADFLCGLSLLVAVHLCFAASPTTAQSEPVTLRYGQAYSALNSIFALPIVVAEREGFFAREGLKVESIIIPNGGEGMVAALDDGSVELTHVSTPFLIRAALAGSDAVAIAAEFNNPIYSLLAKPELASFAALKGHVIGLAEEASPVTFATRRLLALNGLRDGDFRVAVVSGTPDRLNCLKRGACDAVPLGQPQDLIAEGQGFRVLGLSSDAVPEFLYTVTAVRRSWAAAHADLVVRYLRALAEAFAFIRDPARRDEVASLIATADRTSPEIARRILALYFAPDRKVLPRAGEIRIEGLAEVIREMHDAGTLTGPLPDPRRFVDLSYLQAAGIE